MKSIRTQVSGILVLVLLSAFTVSGFYINQTLAQRFALLEERETSTNIERVGEAIADRIAYLGGRIGDWGNWDDSYTYMKTKSPDFEKSNLTLDGIDSMGIDAIRYYTLDRKEFGVVDRETKDGSPDFKKLFTTHLAKIPELFPAPDSKDIATGAIRLDGSYFSFATMLVRPTSGEGAANGYIMFLNRIDAQFAEKVSNLTKLKINLSPVSKLSKSDKDIDLSKVKSISSAQYLKANSSTINAVVHVKDVKGEDILSFSFDFSRDLMAQGAATLQTVVSSFIVVSIFTIIALLFSMDRAMIRPVISLGKEVNTISDSGQSSQRVTVVGQNEISVLAGQINQMLGTIDEKSKAIRDIVTNVKSGFLVCDAKGIIKDGYTQFTTTLLDQDQLTSHKLSNILFKHQKDRDNWDALFDQVIENFVPEEITMSQLPSKIEFRDKKWLSITGAGLYDPSGAMTGILFTISDVTKEEESERKNRENYALLKILKSFNNFIAFKEHSKAQLGFLQTLTDSEDTQKEIRRTLHTLKGNLSVFGMTDLAKLVHDIEGLDSIAQQHLQRISQELRTFLNKNRDLLNIDFDQKFEPTVTLTRPRIERFKDEALNAKTLHECQIAATSLVSDATLVPFADVAQSLVEEAKRIAVKTGKQVDVNVTGGTLLVGHEYLRPIVDNMVHCIRNSLDHGIETSSERNASGKSSRGLLTLGITRSNGDSYIITVSDDGKGVTQDNLIKAAIAKKILPDQMPKNPFELVFIDGLSTKATANEYSGRGVGMAALKRAVEGLGGTVKFESKVSLGTSVTIEIKDPSYGQVRKFAA